MIGSILAQLKWPIVIVIVLAVLAPLLEPGSKRGRLRARRLMTDREVRFWHLLRVAADPLHVAPQVAMGALLEAVAGSPLGTRNRFDRKRVDFVIIADRGDVALLVELDDRTHRRDADLSRDRMTAQAGYRTLRVSGAPARDPHLLRAALDEALGRPASWSPPVGSPRARAAPVDAAGPRPERRLAP